MHNFNVFKRYLKTVIDIKSDQESEQETYNEVRAGILFRGTNLWIMAMAMIISCIGLNINSKAAVIGAMIISPLMGPVFGVGFSLGISDIDLLRLSFKNLFRIVLICLLCSTLYYLLNPYHVATEELLSFSSPTLFDILLAFFGGLAGFIAISRKEGNRVLVGVAVATACIPPLCTAGYGFATLQWQYIIGGLYTYALNSVFICLSTYIMTRYLKFKRNENQNISRVNLLFTIIASLTLIPGAYLAYKMGVKNIYLSKADHFIQQELANHFHVINQEINPQSKTITIDISSDIYDSLLVPRLKQKLNDYSLETTDLVIHQTSTNQAIIVEMQNEIEKLKSKVEKFEKENHE